MIIFNTLKSAQHYVKWCQKNRDYNRGHYEWSSSHTYIDKNLVIVVDSGDSCGCGCDQGRYSSIRIIGRIKAWNDKTIRDSKLENILK